jgi:glycosyltransferase involved in cell wall biosynthesis
MPAMRIYHFIYDHIGNPWVGGGGAVRAREIYGRLASRHDITIVAGKYPGAQDYEEGGLKFRFVGTARESYILSTFCYAARAAAFLKRHRDGADIVVEDFAPYNPVFSRFVFPGPVVLQVHHREAMNLLRRYIVFGVPFFLVERFYPGLFRNAVCVSEASRGKFGLRGAAVIPNGVDEGLLETTPSDGDYIAYIGRLHIHNKGLDTLAEAMASSGGKLSIAGRGRDEERLKGLVNALGAGDRVEFKGYMEEDEKRGFLSGSKFLVLPSRYEGQGIVILEAAACGKPVLVSDIPELRFAVEAGFGVSFRTGDAGDLAAKMAFLSDNELLRGEMGRRARQYARDFTWDRMARKFENYLMGIKGKSRMKDEEDR